MVCFVMTMIFPSMTPIDFDGDRSKAVYIFFRFHRSVFSANFFRLALFFNLYFHRAFSVIFLLLIFRVQEVINPCQNRKISKF